MGTFSRLVIFQRLIFLGYLFSVNVGQCHYTESLTSSDSTEGNEDHAAAFSDGQLSKVLSDILSKDLGDRASPEILQEVVRNVREYGAPFESQKLSPKKSSYEPPNPPPPSAPIPVRSQPQSNYGPPHEPIQNYGPPGGNQRQPNVQYGPPPEKQRNPLQQYGPPQKQRQPQQQYGPPPQKIRNPQQQYGPPQKLQNPPQQYGLPQKQRQLNQLYGPPPQKLQTLAQQYGPPNQNLQNPPQQYGPPPQKLQNPPQQYGPPPQKLQNPPQQYGPPPQKLQNQPQQYGPPQKQRQLPLQYGPPQQQRQPPQQYGPPQKQRQLPQQYKPPQKQRQPPQQYGPPQKQRQNPQQYGPPPPPPEKQRQPPSQQYGPPAQIKNQPPRGSSAKRPFTFSLLFGKQRKNKVPNKVRYSPPAITTPSTFVTNYPPITNTIGSNLPITNTPQPLNPPKFNLGQPLPQTSGPLTPVHQEPSFQGGYQSPQTPVSENEIEDNRSVFIYGPPDEPLDAPSPTPVRIKTTPEIQQERNYQIIFIKAPSPPTPSQMEIQMPPPPEHKTLVYVLVKKPSSKGPEIRFTQPKSTPPPSPEVFFIKYRQNKEGQVDYREKLQTNSKLLQGYEENSIVAPRVNMRLPSTSSAFARSLAKYGGGNFEEATYLTSSNKETSDSWLERSLRERPVSGGKAGGLGYSSPGSMPSHYTAPGSSPWSSSEEEEHEFKFTTSDYLPPSTSLAGGYV